MDGFPKQSGRRVGVVRRGEVWLVALDPAVGSEVQKARPCLVVSPDELNRVLSTSIIVPLTTGSRPTRFRVPSDFRGKDGLFLPDQIRIVARQRLMTRLGTVDANTLSAVLRVVREMFTD